MAATKKATHQVVHPSLYMMVSGKLRQMEVGAKLTLSDEQAKRLGKKVKALGSSKTVNVGEDA